MTGVADAEVIPVGRVDDVLVLQLRIAAFELGDDVLRVDRAQRVLDRDRRLEPSGTGLNSRVGACFLSASKSWPAILQDLLRRVERDPAFDGRAAMFLSGVTRSKFSRRIALDDRERIAGRPGLVDDEHAGRAPARAFSYL